MLDGFFGLRRMGIAAESVTSPTPPRSHESKAVEMRLDALELACAGLWRLLKEHHGYTDDQLVKWIEFVDQEDGNLDGKRNPKSGNCPQCGRPALTRARGKCLWCGAEMPKQPL